MASEVIASYAGLPSTSEETVVLAPLVLPAVLNFINILPTTYTLTKQFDQASLAMPYILLVYIITSKFGDEQWQKFT